MTRKTRKDKGIKKIQHNTGCLCAVCIAARITLTPREAVSGTPVSSWWIGGSRDRYGVAYFVSDRSKWRTGATEADFVLMAYRGGFGGINVEIGALPAEGDWTWATIDALIQEGR